MRKFSRLKGVSEVRRLPRLGKIRLGIKKKSQRSGAEYPAEVDYFVVPEEVAAVYGDKPKMLDVMLPMEAVEDVMPVAYKYYKSSGLYCIGDGEQANRRDDELGGMREIECPCPFLDESNKCARMAVINVVLPKVNMGGVYQIATGSWHSIVAFQSGMDYTAQMIGRCSWVPLKLERVPQEIQHTDTKKNKTTKQTHYTLRLTFEGNIDFINRLKDETKRILAGPQYKLPAPEVNPHADPVDVVDGALITDDGEVIRDAKATVVSGGDNSAAAGRQAKSGPQEGEKERAANSEQLADPPQEAKPEKAPKKPRTLDSVRGLWKKVSTAYGEAAQNFWKFVINDYFGASASSEVTVDRAKPLIDKITKIAKLSDPQDAANELWENLRHEVADRQSQDEAAGAASEASA